MIAVEDSDDIFEISDFTVVTEWERFVSLIETQLRDWELAGPRPRHILKKADMIAGDWNEKQAELRLGDLGLRISYTCLKLPSESSSPTASPATDADSHLPAAALSLKSGHAGFLSTWSDRGVPSLCQFFGLTEWICLTPVCDSDIIRTESRRNTLISALLVASHGCDCQVPLFVQIDKVWRQLYSGVCQNHHVRLRFDMAHLQAVAVQQNKLANLVDIFKAHINCPVVPMPSIEVSVRLHFSLQESLESQWCQNPPEVDIGGTQMLRFAEFGDMPFGACQDPIGSFELYTSWYNIDEDMLVENDIYSDLNPLTAPFWDLKVAFAHKLDCLLSDSLSQFLDLCMDFRYFNDVLGIVDLDGEEASAALSRLTKSPAAGIIPFRSAIERTTAKSLELVAPTAAQGKDLPIPPESMVDFLQYLFPDANLRNSSKGDSPVNTTKKPQQCSSSQRSDRQCSTDSFDDAMSVSTPAENISSANALVRLKTAPLDSLAGRLSVCALQALTSVRGRKAICQLWHEFVLEMRYRWEQGVVIPLLEEGPPDLSSCTFHQDLQMLNCCIVHKLRRRQRQSGSGEDAALDATLSSSDSDPDDAAQFYDCAESREQLWSDVKPEGRLKQCGKHCLLHKPETPLYIPVTEDPSPVTETMLMEQASVLSTLGTSLGATLLRAKMQSASLLSDMQAFKAANPGCCLEDFVRWFSPRDWVSDDSCELGGRLSERMSVPGNMWEEVWDAARPLPVFKQRRLFDDTKEAEKILHAMNSLKVADIAELLCPVLFAHAFVLVKNEAGDALPVVSECLDRLAQALTHATRSSVGFTTTNYQACLQHLRDTEARISAYRALQCRFTAASNSLASKPSSRISPEDLKSFLASCMQETEVAIPGASKSPIGQIISSVFQSDTRVEESGGNSGASFGRLRFPPAEEREYILRWSIPHPATGSRSVPQRLYARVNSEAFRLAVATGEDVTFF